MQRKEGRDGGKKEAFENDREQGKTSRKKARK